MVGPPLPPTLQENKSEEGEDEDTHRTESVSEKYQIPDTNEIQLSEHSRAVSALALDPSGSRLLSGSYDYKIHFWDFNGMDSRLRSFRSIEPFEGNQIISLQYSLTGEKFLVTTGDVRAAIYTRDGKLVEKTVRGDMYLTDMSNTKGHVTTLGNGQWHPSEKDIFMTCSLDSTVRFWDVNTMKTKQTTVIKVRNAQNKKVGVTRCIYTRDAKSVIVAAQDGSLQTFPVNGNHTRPTNFVKEAHIGEISHLAISEDNVTLLSRANDDTLKIWDLRNLKVALHTVAELPTFGDCQCIFSPNDKMILTCTAVTKKDVNGSGLLMFYDKQTFAPIKQLGISRGAGGTALLWHPKLNQILVGTTDSKVHVLFDPKLSHNGALLSVVKAPRVANPLDFEPERPVIVPYALRMFRETPNQRRREAKEALDPRIRSGVEVKPTPPPAVKTTNMKNLLYGSSNKYLIEKYFPEKMRPVETHEDPREALLKQAEKTEKKSYFFKIYEKNQPTPIFDYDKLNEEEGPVLSLKEKIEKEKKQANRNTSQPNWD